MIKKCMMAGHDFSHSVCRSTARGTSGKGADEKGRNCCDSNDCKPAHYRHTLKGVKMFVDKHWVDVPNGAIQYRALPGDTGETAGDIGAVQPTTSRDRTFAPCS